MGVQQTHVEGVEVLHGTSFRGRDNCIAGTALSGRRPPVDDAVER